MITADTLRLQYEVEHALEHNPEVRAADIVVQVIDGHVVLTGVVATVAEREAAGQTAARVAAQMGETARLENDLTVEFPREASKRELQQAVDAALAAAPGVPTDAVGARVEDGVAFLVGHVVSTALEEAAIAAARRVPGLKEVVSQLTIATGAPPEPAALVNRVQDALGQDARLHLRPITVDADPQGTVTIGGAVANNAERAAAAQLAKAVPGVHQVVNRIEIQGVERPLTMTEG
jgi:osmotically-inducible protein OsmY